MKMFDDGNIPVSGIDVKATLEQVKYIESECAAWKRSLRAFIEEEGAYDNGDGTQIILQAQNRRTILPREAWPILVDAIGEDALSEAMTISITKVEKIVAANAPKTFGAKAKRELYDTLVEAGAIRLKESKSIRVVPVTT